MSGGIPTTWRSLLDETKARFDEWNCEIPPISAESVFVEKFEGLCKKQKQLYYTRLLGSLKLSKIDAFARAVDKVAQHAPPNTVSSLVYGATFVVLESAWKAGVKPGELAKSLAELHTAFPLVHAESVSLLDEHEPHNALHEILGKHFDALLKIISYLAPNSTEDDHEPHQRIKEHINATVKEMQTQNAAYIKMLETAALKKTKKSQMQNGVVVNGIYGQHDKNDATAHYTSVRPLGQGVFGKVDEVQAVSGGAMYARKRIEFYGDSAARGQEEEVLNEISIMEKLTHQHIVAVRFWLQEEYVYSIFMKPVADFNLLDFLLNCCKEGYPETSAQRIYSWFGCLLDALNFAHRRGIMHRDIKPRNILIKEDQIYLADFGSAKDLNGKTVTLSKDYFLYGTPVYRAPETRIGQAAGSAADMFSLGCVFSEMLTVVNHRLLTDFQSWRKASENECGPYAFRANLPKVRSWLHELESDILQPIAVVQVLNMMKENPATRPSARDGIKLLRSDENLFFCTNH